MNGTRLGKIMIRTKTTASGKIKGKIALISFSMGNSLTYVITRRIIPIGLRAK